ncbi:MAG: DivIVA domain-containing protein [Syntrophomonadaceae bacterium]|nr:DivIVA domain-containing protein [Syntrophomonadaceae bacterium]
MISPIEVRRQEFSQTVRGYRKDEVDSFLKNVSDEFERLYRENAELKEALQRAEADMLKYRKLEDTLNQTLLLAQQTAEEIRANAHKEAQTMLEGARHKINETFAAYEEILKMLNIYRAEIKSYLNSQVEFMERHDKRIDELTSVFYAKDSKNLLEAFSKNELKIEE